MVSPDKSIRMLKRERKEILDYMYWNKYDDSCLIKLNEINIAIKQLEDNEQ